MTTPILTTYRAKIATAEKHRPFGKLTARDMETIIKRTAQAHNVSEEVVREAVEKADD